MPQNNRVALTGRRPDGTAAALPLNNQNQLVVSSTGGGGGGASLADSSIIDNNGVYWLVRDDGTNLTYLNWATGAAGSPAQPVKPVGAGSGRTTSTNNFTVVTAGTGYSVGDILQRLVELDISGATPKVLSAAWVNVTQGTILANAPVIANLNPIDDNVQVTIADGAFVTFGATTDPVTAAMDNNPHTFMSLFKGAFQFLQNISTVVGNSFAIMVTGTQLPASLGPKTSAASISTVPASDSGLTPGAWVNLSAAQLAGLAVVLPNAGGVQLQFGNVSADSLLVEHTADGVNWKTALLARQDPTQVTLLSGAGITGTTANAVYTIALFGGQFRVTRTGTADAGLTAGYRSMK